MNTTRFGALPLAVFGGVLVVRLRKRRRTEGRRRAPMEF